MIVSVHSIHHVTAITAEIGRNHQFYTQTLGLRLVKKSVNQDDVSAYHLFYADAVGTPGTDMTFFDWPQIPRREPGQAEASKTAFRIPNGASDWWKARLALHDLRVEETARSDGRIEINFEDFEGQRLSLVTEGAWPKLSTPHTAVTPIEFAITGILGVDLCSARPDSTARVLSEVLGYQAFGDTFRSEDDLHVGEVRLVSGADKEFARQGSGGVHHVAFRVSSKEELLDVGAKVEKLGIRTSGFIDRYYFKSLYFREPGGVLFELATDGPGFASDEPQESLGETLALPPFLESRRAEIEAGLKPL